MTPSLVFFAIAGTGEEAGTAALLNLVVAAFAVLLLALSVSAFLRTRMKRLIYVTAAFGFFAASVAVRNLEMFVFPGVDVDEILVTALELVTLILFFAALVVKE